MMSICPFAFDVVRYQAAEDRARNGSLNPCNAMLKEIPLHVAYEIIIRQSFRDVLELARVPPTLIAYRYVAVHANAAINVMPAYF